MIFSSVFAGLSQLWWLVPFVILALLLKSPWVKGWIGETMVKISAKLYLPQALYHRIHNVTLTTPDGSTQIDHIFVSQFGVFVVETKHMKGWIFGSEKQATWTQKIFRQTFKFQNPLRQNYKHVKTLEAMLPIPAECIHSVIAFTGDCTFKTPMPDNVRQNAGWVRFIQSFKAPVLNAAQVQEVVTIVQTLRLPESRKTSREHVQRLKARKAPAVQVHPDSHAKPAPERPKEKREPTLDQAHQEAVPVVLAQTAPTLLSKPDGGQQAAAPSGEPCVKCGAEMVQRTAKKGPYAGQKFWGCSTFPQCKNVLALAHAPAPPVARASYTATKPSL